MSGTRDPAHLSWRMQARPGMMKNSSSISSATASPNQGLAFFLRIAIRFSVPTAPADVLPANTHGKGLLPPSTRGQTILPALAHLTPFPVQRRPQTPLFRQTYTSSHGKAMRKVTVWAVPNPTSGTRCLPSTPPSPMTVTTTDRRRPVRAARRQAGKEDAEGLPRPTRNVEIYRRNCHARAIA
jgi:hypothetical protein